MSLEVGDKLGDGACIVKLKGYRNIPQVVLMLVAAEGRIENLEHHISIPLEVAFLVSGILQSLCHHHHCKGNPH